MNPILEVFERNCGKRPQALAVADASLTLSYQALHALACGLSRRIRDQAKAQNIGLMVPTSAAGTAAILACWYAGKTPVPLNFMLAPAELGRIAQDAKLDLIITIEMFALPLAQAGIPLLVLNADTLTPGRADAPHAARDEIAVIIYTSGTTGVAKGACLTFDNVLHNSAACVTHARIDPDQVFLNVLPQFHSFGFTTMTILPLTIGAGVWVQPKFTPASIVSLIAEKQVTIFIAVASMYAALIKHKGAEASALKSLRLAIAGGEPLPPNVERAFRARFGLDLLEGYGMTESSPVVSVNVPWANRPGSVGKPLPGVTVWTADATGQRLPTGEVGEIVIGGHGVMRGYFNRSPETTAVLRSGCMYSGDVGRVDQDGYVFITGRAKDMLIVGGENVFPREIEDALGDHPAVVEAAVIGIPDTSRGEAPAAFVVLHPGVTADTGELKTWCRARLASYKTPREVHILADMPRGPSGKILKQQLRTMV